MADSKVSALTETSAPALDDILYSMDVSDTTDGAGGSSRKLTLQRMLGFLRPSICDGRLTTESGVPVSTSDRTAQGTIYFTPHIGDKVSLYDGTRWRLYTFTERSLALTVTADKNYDVFLYDNAGTLTLELSAAWTNDSTRADALTTQDSVFVKSGSTTRRWIGTIRASATNQTEFSLAKRFVWNAQNRVPMPMADYDATSSWTYTLAVWQQANANTANQLAFICGDSTRVSAQAVGTANNSSAGIGRFTGIGVDSTTSPTGVVGTGGAAGNVDVSQTASLDAIVAAGYHYLAWLEYSAATGTCTWKGTQAPKKSGIVGTLTC